MYLLNSNQISLLEEESFSVREKMGEILLRKLYQNCFRSNKRIINFVVTTFVNPLKQWKMTLH